MLTDPDRQLVLALLNQIRVVAEQHVACWGPGVSVSRLIDLGLVERRIIFAKSFLPLDRPMFCSFWGEPDCSKLSYQCERRWAELPERKTNALVVTKKARRLFGSRTTGNLNHDHLSHDLHVGLLFARLREKQPELVPFWVGEDARKKGGNGLVPDVLFVDEQGRPRLVWDVLGVYGATRLRELIALADGLPWAWW